MLDSTVLTIGTALRRAQDAGLPVEVLIHGEWIGGMVLGLDGHGAILDGDHGESAVIRLQDACAVKVHPAEEARGAAAPRTGDWDHRVHVHQSAEPLRALG
ncbi:hypothetical protein [Nocardioides coralli]|uniref:hypothetical protein n=1 Tax=Nocardioides coralli TaxID=2872154 RepID=UPI001CA4391E|nr:hypothetical protein [Nocardioides coralli]QZY28475.1 hypothetical protein K6T13_13520 [Nocardioides coralli]